MRLLLISVMCVIIAVIGLFIARFSGLQTQYQRFEGEFLNGPKPAFFVVVGSLEEARNILDQRPTANLWVNVHQTADEKLLILTREEVASGMTEKSFGEKWKGPFTPKYVLADLRVVFPKAPLLGDFLTAFPQTKFILNIIDNGPRVDIDVADFVSSAHAGNRVLIQSDFESVMKDIKAKQPLWIFGTGRGDIMRLISFESMWLEPASPFFGDVYISPVSLHGRSMLNEGVDEEIHRRKKDVYLGPLESEAEYDAARHEKVEGFILASPALAEKIFAKP